MMNVMKALNLNHGFKSEVGQSHDCHNEVERTLPPRLAELIRTKFAALWEQRPHLLHLAVTEATALANSTGFPQLFLPALALEKAETASRWHRRQRDAYLTHPLARGFRAP
jgi:hypothetical protein